MIENREYFEYLLLKELSVDVDNDYILFGVPKHRNVGDLLIWESENDLFSKLNKKRINTYFFYTEPKDIQILDNEIIIWNGGGYFGNMWNFMSYFEKIESYFKKNKIIFMPNSMYFSCQETINKLQKIISLHNNLIVIYCRDEQSYNLTKKYFKFDNVIIKLLPDVVLTWDIDKYLSRNKINLNNKSEKKLYISRCDKEKIKNNINIEHFDKISDWPNLMKNPNYIRGNETVNEWDKTIKVKLINNGINFINDYGIIYSDRLHGAILSLLLEKKTFLIDNIYGKSKSLYETWLKDNNIQIIA